MVKGYCSWYIKVKDNIVIFFHSYIKQFFDNLSLPPFIIYPLKILIHLESSFLLSEIFGAQKNPQLTALS